MKPSNEVCKIQSFHLQVFIYFLLSIASQFRAIEFLMGNRNNANDDTSHIISPFNRKLSTVVTFKDTNQ